MNDHPAESLALLLISFVSYQVVVNSLLSAIPEIGNVSLVCLIFWLVFSVVGVHFFGGRFYKCVDDNGDTLHHTIVDNKTSCLGMNYTWRNSDINFDNSLSGFLALFQVVSQGSFTAGECDKNNFLYRTCSERRHEKLR